MKKILVATIIVAAGLVAFLGCENIVRSFSATLTGSEVVPAVSTAATGNCIANLDAAGTEIGYKLTVQNLENLTSANLHLAPAGRVGEVIAVLYPGPTKPGPFTGTLAEATLRVADLRGPLAGEPMSRMNTVLRAGSTYVQVNTDSFPQGEIRGQLR
ncbi:MAG: CHRD domain-containing protein [bacterium]